MDVARVTVKGCMIVTMVTDCNQVLDTCIVWFLVSSECNAY